MPDCEVQVHGAGWAGLAIAKGLADAGVDVRLVDPAVAREGAWGGAAGRSLGLVLPTHPEHPHRLEAGIGTAAAAELVAFIRAGLDQLPGLARVGVDWRASPQEMGELDLALAAARRIGLEATRTKEGYHLHDGGVVDLAVLRAALTGPPVYADAVTAEIDVYATGAGVSSHGGGLDPFLADKITAVRWQAVHFDGPAPTVPVVSQHATVFWTGGEIGAGTGGGIAQEAGGKIGQGIDNGRGGTRSGGPHGVSNTATNTLHAAGARWATPHMEVGETVPEPDARVTAMLEKLTRQGFPEAGAMVGVHAAIVGESCDGLPIVGPIPGRPRAIVCTGFGVAGLAYALPCARAVVAGILGRATSGAPPPAAGGIAPNAGPPERGAFNAGPPERGASVPGPPERGASDARIPKVLRVTRFA